MTPLEPFYSDLQYSEALDLDTSSGGSDTDVLRLKAGTVVNFLDWALPEAPQQTPFGASITHLGSVMFIRHRDVQCWLVR